MIEALASLKLNGVEIMKNKTNTVAKPAKAVDSTDTVEVNNIKVDGDLDWDGLVTERNNVVNDIINQQALVLEMSIKFKDILLKDEKLTHMMNGLMLSIQDLAENVAEITKSHKDANGEFFKGITKNDDETLEYLRIASTYIAIGENLANLIATAHVDIFSKLTTNKAILDSIEEAKKEANKSKNIPKVGENKNGK